MSKGLPTHGSGYAQTVEEDFSRITELEAENDLLRSVDIGVAPGRGTGQLLSSGDWLDAIKRARKAEADWEQLAKDFAAACDKIKNLEAENVRYREALEKIDRNDGQVPWRFVAIARTALYHGKTFDDPEEMRRYLTNNPQICGLCGHQITFGTCGSAYADDTTLCHTDSHSCYHRWTVYGDRPSPQEPVLDDRNTTAAYLPPTQHPLPKPLIDEAIESAKLAQEEK